MATIGLTGFFQGFTETSLALQKLKQARDKELQEIELRKEDLKLRRDLLRGQEASRKLQDQIHMLGIEKALREYGQSLRGQQELALLAQPESLPAPAAPSVPPRVGEATSGMTEQVTRPAPTAPLATPGPGPGATAPVADRLNNPLNIKYGGATTYLVDEGVATRGPAAPDGGHFLHFRDPAQGFQAAEALLRSPVYSGLSVHDALKKWSNNGYDGRLALRVGVDPSARVAALTPAQRTQVLQAMAAVERGGGPSPGTATPGAPEELVRLRGLESERSQLEQRLQQLTAVREQFTTPAARQDIDKRIDDTRQAIQLKETQIGRLHQRLEPGSEFAALVRKHHGNLPAALDEAQQRQTAQRAAEAQAGVEARLQAEVTAKQRQALQDAVKDADEAERFRDTQTAEAIDPTMPYGRVQELQRHGQVRKVSKAQQEKLETLQQTIPVLQRLAEYYQAIYGPGGVYASMTMDDRRTWEGLLRQGRQISDQLAHRYPLLLAAQRYATSNLEAIARGLKAVKGAGTEGDIQRVEAGLPRLLSTFGVKGYVLDISLPDTRAVALRVWDDLVTTVNKGTGILLGNPQFHWPGLPTTP